LKGLLGKDGTALPVDRAEARRRFNYATSRTGGDPYRFR